MTSWASITDASASCQRTRMRLAAGSSSRLVWHHSPGNRRRSPRECSRTWRRGAAAASQCVSRRPPAGREPAVISTVAPRPLGRCTPALTTSTPRRGAKAAPAAGMTMMSSLRRVGHSVAHRSSGDPGPSARDARRANDDGRWAPSVTSGYRTKSVTASSRCRPSRPTRGRRRARPAGLRSWHRSRRGRASRRRSRARGRRRGRRG